MNFELVIKRVVGALETEGIHYALIGGFAMALRGRLGRLGTGGGLPADIPLGRKASGVKRIPWQR
jgi:hypothetical protein